MAYSKVRFLYSTNCFWSKQRGERNLTHLKLNTFLDFFFLIFKVARQRMDCFTMHEPILILMIVSSISFLRKKKSHQSSQDILCLCNQSQKDLLCDNIHVHGWSAYLFSFFKSMYISMELTISSIMTCLKPCNLQQGSFNENLFYNIFVREIIFLDTKTKCHDFT